MSSNSTDMQFSSRYQIFFDSKLRPLLEPLTAEEISHIFRYTQLPLIAFVEREEQEANRRSIANAQKILETDQSKATQHGQELHYRQKDLSQRDYELQIDKTRLEEDKKALESTIASLEQKKKELEDLLQQSLQLSKAYRLST